ncbi:hypothetical protein M9H77_04168 [Catharanthus roseus]|uniref:Uncharacterized protein n=1 Tax=Catharanthus roseus TaxID=4058 RepID=A0ACC0CDD2_CATRO|nr:hypothetical protein M9H77_04168 [Catharanthus roseus]
MEEKEGKQQELMLKPSSSLTIPSSESNSMLSTTLGRVMHTLLNTRPRKLQDTISRLQSPPKMAPLSVSLEQSLWFLHKYVGEAAEKGKTLDEVLVPMIEHSLKFLESKHNSQSLILLNWLFQDEVLFQALATNLADVVSRKDDHYIAFGWCIIARALIEYETSMNKLLTNGIREKYPQLLKVLSSCITHLLALVCSGSTLREGFVLPTRLAVAAADFIISHTVALTRKDLDSGVSANKEKLFTSNLQNQSISTLAAASNEKVKTASKGLELSKNLEMKSLLWAHMDDLITLVDRLRAWSRKSRSLHLRGLERVFNWLQETKRRYLRSRNEAGRYGNSEDWNSASLIMLETLWNAVALSRLQLLSAIQRIVGPILVWNSDNHGEEPSLDKDGGTETVKFFLTCLSLLLGRLDSKQFETALADYGPQLSKVLISQLRSVDEEVIDGAVSIFRAAVFRSNQGSSRDCLGDTREMKAVMPMLLHLLDERDGAAKAVIKLVAEYCSLCLDIDCLKEVLKRLISGNGSQKMNAVDVISDLINISAESVTSLSPQMWQDIADKLLECLADEESVIQARSVNLIPSIARPLITNLKDMLPEVNTAHHLVSYLLHLVCSFFLPQLCFCFSARLVRCLIRSVSPTLMTFSISSYIFFSWA